MRTKVRVHTGYHIGLEREAHPKHLAGGTVDALTGPLGAPLAASVHHLAASVHHSRVGSSSADQSANSSPYKPSPLMYCTPASTLPLTSWVIACAGPYTQPGGAGAVGQSLVNGQL
ncbi:MAG: hypothetical protein GKR94_17365 [Gammaproteobacteria bacterium]|nr:hypothetical protein [Gammaproteobacteria bacterium]